MSVVDIYELGSEKTLLALKDELKGTRFKPFTGHHNYILENIMSKLTDPEWVKLIEIFTDNVHIPNIRHGQAYFNALHAIRPDLAKQISGTSLDPLLRR